MEGLSNIIRVMTLASTLRLLSDGPANVVCSATVLRKNLASAKIVKIEFNANSYLLGVSPFYNI